MLNTLKLALWAAILGFGAAFMGACSAGVEVDPVEAHVHHHGPGCGHYWDGHEWR
jgi:hypothetical protein